MSYRAYCKDINKARKRLGGIDHPQEAAINAVTSVTSNQGAGYSDVDQRYGQEVYMGLKWPWSVLKRLRSQEMETK
jgi:hypothetical protein